MEKSGIRIQKVLSDNGILSRRKAEEAIAKGRITVNGHPCQIGQKVNPKKDIVALDGQNLPLNQRKNNLYIMLNKPRGYVTTTSDELGRRCVTDLMKDVGAKVYPVGRLDRNSEGLLLFTNDGNFANTIMHPSNHISKTYRATVRPEISEEQLIKLSTGVLIEGDDKPTLPASVHVLAKETGRTVLQITIFEGRNRQIRRMCEAVGLEVARLKRVSVGPLKLGMLKPGSWRELTPGELTGLRGSVQKAENRAAHERSFGRRKAAAGESGRRGRAGGGSAQGAGRTKPDKPRDGGPKQGGRPAARGESNRKK